MIDVYNFKLYSTLKFQISIIKGNKDAHLSYNLLQVEGCLKIKSSWTNTNKRGNQMIKGFLFYFVEESKSYLNLTFVTFVTFETMGRLYLCCTQKM